MVDNIAITPGTGATVATDDVGGIQYQRVKLTWGTDGIANDADIATGKPLPSQLRHSDGTIISDTTGIKISTSQLAPIQTTQQPFASGAQGVFLPSDHPTLTVSGGVAHAAADSGNPIKNGFKATTSLAGLTLVTNAQRTDGYSGVDGVQIVRPHCNLEDLVSNVLANTDGTSQPVIASQGAGVKTYVTTVIVANTSATAVTMNLRDGAAGTVKATFPVPASTSGVVCNLPVPLAFSAATAVCMHTSTAASTVTCTLIGFKSKV
jgi:hypothetical protein